MFVTEGHLKGFYELTSGRRVHLGRIGRQENGAHVLLHSQITDPDSKRNAKGVTNFVPHRMDFKCRGVSNATSGRRLLYFP